MPREIRRVATMHVVYKKSILLEIEGFNEKLKTGYDCEIGYKINDAGYKIIFLPDAIVYHHHRDNLRAYFKQQFEYGQYGIIRYLDEVKIARGDQLTPLRLITQPLYYVVSLIFFILWLALYFWRKDIRKEMIIISAFFGIGGVLSELVNTVDWWKPLTITNTLIGIEDFLIGFFIGGVNGESKQRIAGFREGSD